MPAGAGTAGLAKHSGVGVGGLGGCVGAVAIQPFRLVDAGVTATVFSLLLLVAVFAAVVLGQNLRGIDDRRERAVQAVRQDERISLARELHDFVAHHVTGIVVQAQAAEVVAADSDTAVVTALRDIEQAGSEALASMRRLVHVLRDDDPDPGSDVDIQQLQEFVAGFSAQPTAPTTLLTIDDEIVRIGTPPVIAATAHRLSRKR